MKAKEWDLIQTCYVCDGVEVRDIFRVVNIDWNLFGKNETHNLNLDALDDDEYKIINQKENMESKINYPKIIKYIQSFHDFLPVFPVRKPELRQALHFRDWIYQLEDWSYASFDEITLHHCNRVYSLIH